MTVSLAQGQNEIFALLGVVILIIALVAIGVGILYGVSLMRLFTKAGVEGWRAWVPVYSAMTRAEISGRPSWWGLHVLLGFVISPVDETLGLIAGAISLVVNIFISLDTAKSFGRGSGFGVGIALLGFIFMPILAFSDSRYVGPAGPEGAGWQPQPGGPAYQAPQGWGPGGVEWGQQPQGQWGQQPEQPWGQQPDPYGQRPGPYGQQPQETWGQQPGPWGQQPDPYGQQPGPNAGQPGRPGEPQWPSPPGELPPA